MIEQFVKELLKEKDLPGNLEPAVYDRMVRDLSERATNMVNKHLVESLNSQQLEEFESLMDKHPDDLVVLQKFIDGNVKNKQQITSAALLEFRSLYLGTA